MSDRIFSAAALGVAASIAVVAGACAVEALEPQQAAQVQPAPAIEPAAKAVALVSDGVAAKPAADPSCPQVSMTPGAGSFPKKDDDFKATLEALARDCANLGAETIMKVSLVGEGERDSAEGPSWFNAPIRLLIRDDKGETVENRKISLKVELPTGAERVPFEHLVEGVSLPASTAGYQGWTVVVGFDAGAQPAPAVTAKKIRPAKTSRSAAVRRATRTARAAPPQPLPNPVAVAPAPAATGSTSDSPWKRMADSFSERRDKVRVEEQQRAAQAQQQRQPRPPAARPVQQPTPQPQARVARPQPAPPIRTAERTTALGD